MITWILCFFEFWFLFGDQYSIFQQREKTLLDPMLMSLVTDLYGTLFIEVVSFYSSGSWMKHSLCSSSSVSGLWLDIFWTLPRFQRLSTSLYLNSIIGPNFVCFCSICVSRGTGGFDTLKEKQKCIGEGIKMPWTSFYMFFNRTCTRLVVFFLVIL